LKLPLGKYDIAHYAYEIERLDLKMAGGKQDQYSATFGGVNFMEFMDKDKVIVNPLRIDDDILQEWALNTVLFFTDQKRESSRIIEEQANNVKNKNNESLEAMHKVKQEAFRIKNNLLREELQELGKALNTSWVNKKKMAQHISNNFIDKIYETALSNGALGGKISGAGGGGFMFFYCPGNTRYNVVKSLEDLKAGKIYFFDFYKKGLTTWTVKEK
jgi:D-glycero-alpha-D-manno-heptose-7-phosphate kinase